jgi:hypothetical protein
MESQNSEGQGNFWPGYVAAMASLVQSLLLLTVILAFVIYQMGVLASKRVDQAAAITLAEHVVQTPQHDVVESPSTEIRIHFEQEIWQIDEATKQQIKREVTRPSYIDCKWLLKISDEMENALIRRSAYLRLMVVRNLILSFEIDANRIETRMLSDSAASTKINRQTVRLVSLCDKKGP